MRQLWWWFKCEKLGVHRLYETVGNFATGMPTTGYACYECGRRWNWKDEQLPTTQSQSTELGESFAFLSQDDRGRNVVVQMNGYAPKRISTFGDDGKR